MKYAQRGHDNQDVCHQKVRELQPKRREESEGQNPDAYCRREGVSEQGNPSGMESDVLKNSRQRAPDVRISIRQETMKRPRETLADGSRARARSPYLILSAVITVERRSRAVLSR
jgi:hypothetical protein